MAYKHTTISNARQYLGKVLANRIIGNTQDIQVVCETTAIARYLVKEGICEGDLHDIERGDSFYVYLRYVTDENDQNLIDTDWYKKNQPDIWIWVERALMYHAEQEQKKDDEHKRLVDERLALCEKFKVGDVLFYTPNPNDRIANDPTIAVVMKSNANEYEFDILKLIHWSNYNQCFESHPIMGDIGSTTGGTWERIPPFKCDFQFATDAPPNVCVGVDLKPHNATAEQNLMVLQFEFSVYDEKDKLLESYDLRLYANGFYYLDISSHGHIAQRLTEKTPEIVRLINQYVKECKAHAQS